MKDEKNDTADFKSCVKFVGRCEELLEAGKFEIEGNDSKSKFRVQGAGTPKKCLGVRRELFEFFIDIRSWGLGTSFSAKTRLETWGSL